MATTYDFEIISNTSIPGLSLVMPLNESAFTYLTEEAELAVLPDGSAPIFTDNAGDFLSDASYAHFACNYQ